MVLEKDGLTIYKSVLQDECPQVTYISDSGGQFYLQVMTSCGHILPDNWSAV